MYDSNDLYNYRMIRKSPPISLAGRILIFGYGLVSSLPSLIGSNSCARQNPRHSDCENFAAQRHLAAGFEIRPSKAHPQRVEMF